MAVSGNSTFLVIFAFFKKKSNRELIHAKLLSHGRQPEVNLTCPHATTFILSSISKSGREHCPGMRNVQFRSPSVAQIRRFLKLANVKGHQGNEEGSGFRTKAGQRTERKES